VGGPAKGTGRVAETAFAEIGGMKETDPTFLDSAFTTNEARLNTVIRYLRENTSVKGKVVLDIGCGAGAYLDLFHKEGALRCMGVDLSPGNIALAKSTNPSLCLMQGDYMKVSIPEKADLIFSEGAIPCFAETFPEVIQKCFQDLKPGGEIFMTHARSTFKSALVIVLRRILWSLSQGLGKGRTLDWGERVYGRRYSRDFLEKRLIYLKYCPRLLTRRMLEKTLKAAGYDLLRCEKLPCSSFLQADHFFIYARKRNGEKICENKIENDILIDSN
jgi:SAM-dependent methyltransferase